MSQTPIQSAVESIVNIGSGMVIAYSTMQWVLVPILDIKLNYQDNIIVTIVLTVVSMIRSYLWRRFFSRREVKCQT